MVEVLPEQDCFIYIPETLEDGTSASGAESAEGIGPVEANALLFSTSDEWVKISLEGQMVVYAHLWDEE
jgi:hypothetical protein